MNCRGHFEVEHLVPVRAQIRNTRNTFQLNFPEFKQDNLPPMVWTKDCTSCIVGVCTNVTAWTDGNNDNQCRSSTEWHAPVKWAAATLQTVCLTAMTMFKCQPAKWNAENTAQTPFPQKCHWFFKIIVKIVGEGDGCIYVSLQGKWGGVRCLSDFTFNSLVLVESIISQIGQPDPPLMLLMTHSCPWGIVRLSLHPWLDNNNDDCNGLSSLH